MERGQSLALQSNRNRPYMIRIIQPIIRSERRRKLGREYFILHRKLSDCFSSIKWTLPAKGDNSHGCSYPVMEHRSLIMRRLKDVDMYLQENKRTNLRLAISKLHGMIIRPGETFSVWRHVGRPTARKGYLEGLVLSQGKIGKGVGGGLCQLGNLLFWMFAHTPLSIVERHRHSFDVFPDINRSIPFGAGATLSYNYIDLRVRNNTPHTYRLELWLDDTHLNGRISSDTEQRDRYRIEETDHRIEHQSWGGYTRHNKLVRIVTRADGSEYTEPFVENHAIMMYNPLLSPPQNGASTSFQR